MIRLAAPGLLGTLMFCVWIYAVLDSIATDSVLVRNLPKITWVMLVVFVPFVGALAWLGFGRPVNAGWPPGGTDVRPRAHPVRGIEDSEEWTHFRPPAAQDSIEARERRLAEREAELRRREERLDEDEA